MRDMRNYFIFILSLFLIHCGGDSTSTSSSSAATAVIKASTNLDSFTFHGSTSYKANFGATGLTLSATTSASTAGDIASYSWSQVSGPTVTFTSANTTSSTVEFTAPAITAILHASDQYRWQVLPISRDDYLAEFLLTVTDAAGNTDKTTFTVYFFDDGSEIHPTSGLRNVGIGEKVYLSGPSWTGTTGATAVTNWSWALTPPAGSSAIFTDSDTTTSTLQIVSFTPDVSGTYTVTYDSTSDSSAAATLTINASTYVGVGTIQGATANSSLGQCGACHTTNESTWDDTGHSVQFEQVIASYTSKAPAPYCWECHTVGYEPSASGNSGFYDLVIDDSYSFPSTGTTWSAFASDNPTLAPLTNIQCENCHGPGGAHSGTITDSKIYYSNWNAGTCGKCHHQDAEWKNSAHNSTGVKSGRSSYQTSWIGTSCARCHTSGGFIEHVESGEVTSQSNAAIAGTDFVGIGCPACHDPHSQASDAVSGSTAVSGNDSTQLRLKGNVTMKNDARTVVNAGKAAACYECHDGNYSWEELDCDTNGDGTVDATCDTVDQIATQYKRQIHGNPQSWNLEGMGAITTEWTGTAYDFTTTENSWHSSSNFTLANGSGDSSLSDENNKCVTCHVGEAPGAEEEGYRLVGGHSFKMMSGSTEFVSTCTSCHTTLTSLNRTSRADYDGDGTVEGIQDEVSGLLLALSTKIRSIDSTNVVGTGTSESGGVITVAAFSAFTTQATMVATNIDVRRAVYNHNLIAKDGSLGVHNAAFAIQVLQKTYSALSQIHGGNSFASDYSNATLR